MQVQLLGQGRAGQQRDQEAITAASERRERRRCAALCCAAGRSHPARGGAAGGDSRGQGCQGLLILLSGVLRNVVAGSLQGAAGREAGQGGFRPQRQPGQPASAAPLLEWHKGWWQSATISPPLNHPPSQGGTHLEHVVEALGADALDARAPGVHRHNLQRGGGSCGGRFWLEGSCGGTRACGVPGVGAQRLGRACKPHILTIGSQHPAPTLTISSSIPPPHPPPAPTQSHRPSTRLLLAAPWQQHGSRRSRGRGRSSTHLDHQLIDV